MESYLNNPQLPDFLQPASTTIMYSNVNLSDPDKYDENNYKYHQYFANLNRSANPALTTKSTFFPDSSFSYYKSHQVFRPVSRPKDGNYSNDDKNNSDSNNGGSKRANDKSFHTYESFIDVPTLFSDQPLAGTSYHTACDMPDGIYLYGGLQAMLTTEYKEMLKTVTKNFTISPENIRMICDYDLPLPLDKEKIESMSLKLFKSVRKYLPESKSFKSVCDLIDEDEDEDNDEESGGKDSDKSASQDNDTVFNMNKSFKTSSTKSTALNSNPKSLICSGASRLSNRYFMIYGGLEIETSITYPDDSSCIIEKKLLPNDQFWLFDTMTCKFKEIKISIHPTYSSIFPNSMPRFGHSMASVPTNNAKSLKKSRFAKVLGHKKMQKQNASITKNDNNDNNHSKNYSHIYDSNQFNNTETNIPRTSFSDRAIFFVMGGYKLSDSGNSFIAMNDLWKCDFFFDDASTANGVVASPIGSFDLVDDFYSYILDENLCQLPNKSDSLRFSGVFTHSNPDNNINWPAPRGFCSMALMDQDDLIKSVNWKESFNTINENEEQLYYTNTNESTIVSPIPTKKSSLDTSTDKGELSDLEKNSKSPVNLSYSQSASSDSSSNGNRSSSSPCSEGVHTNDITSLQSKVLLIYAGSSIMYTKIIKDAIFNIYYSKSILDDIWIFDFQTELWYDLDNFLNIKKKLSICGHSMMISNSSLNIIGGIEEHHYDLLTYQPNQAEVLGKYDSDKRMQKKNWEEGRELMFKFHSKLKKRKSMQSLLTDAEHVFTQKGIDLTKIESDGYSSYLYYTLNFNTSQWDSIKMAFVTNIEFFAPWDHEKNDKIISGGMLLYNADDINAKVNSSDDILKDGIQDSIKKKNTKMKKSFELNELLEFKTKLRDSTLVLTNGPIFIKDNRVILFSPDVKLIDQKSKKYISGSQKFVGNSIWEIYSTHF